MFFEAVLVHVSRTSAFCGRRWECMCGPNIEGKAHGNLILLFDGPFLYRFLEFLCGGRRSVLAHAKHRKTYVNYWDAPIHLLVSSLLLISFAASPLHLHVFSVLAVMWG